VIGAELMRDAALLGAECHVAEPADQVANAEDGWSGQAYARATLAQQLRAHEQSRDPARIRLCEELGLDTNGYWLVMLCAAVELHPEAAAAVSLLAEDARVQVPTPTVVARLLRGILDVPFVEALSSALDGGAAARLGLVEVLEPVPGLPHSQHALRLAHTELAAAHDDPSALGAHRELVVATVPPAPAPAFDAERVRHAARLLERRRLLVVRGPSRRGARQLACDVAGDLGVTANLVTAEEELPRLAELSRLRDGLLVLDLHTLSAVPQGPLASLHAGLGSLVVLVDETADTGDHAVVDVGAIGYPEAVRIWAQIVGPERAEEMAARFRVSVEEARSALREARDLREPAAGTDDEADAAALEGVAGRIRAQGARRMGRHVSVIETSARLADLVVTDELRLQLDEIVAWHRSSHRVRWSMSLGAVDPAGIGLTCLMAGKSGTGKTFAARCLAAELGLNLYRIDLSQVVSKYIGETEKALAQVFDEVEAGHGLLLFDEADALFGRRSEVKDAHDRYANIEVGYLLQRLESYDGIAILTTNLQGNMDAAFVRRLRFILHFPVPDRELRRRLWERSLPGPEWRGDDLELDALADRFQLNGGAIHNIGLAAAHLAAATDSGRITLAHVIRATQRELQKTGRPSDAAAFGPLAALAGANGAAR
jgi:ATPase family associated with various cellular activities (AAA)